MVEFVERIGVDFLVVVIGISYGVYKFKGDLRFDFERF